MNWAEAEMASAELGDRRLNRRLEKVLKRLGDDPAASIPVACRGWAEVQGAYRFRSAREGQVFPFSPIKLELLPWQGHFV